MPERKLSIPLQNGQKVDLYYKDTDLITLDKLNPRISIINLAHIQARDCTNNVEILDMGQFGKGAFSSKEIAAGSWLIYGGRIFDELLSDAPYGIELNDNQYLIPDSPCDQAHFLQYLPDFYKDQEDENKDKQTVATANFNCRRVYFRVENDSYLTIAILEAVVKIPAKRILGWSYGGDNSYWLMRRESPAFFYPNGEFHHQGYYMELNAMDGNKLKLLLEPDSMREISNLPGFYCKPIVENNFLLIYFPPELQEEFELWVSGENKHCSNFNSSYSNRILGVTLEVADGTYPQLVGYKTQKDSKTFIAFKFTPKESKYIEKEQKLNVYLSSPSKEDLFLRSEIFLDSLNPAFTEAFLTARCLQGVYYHFNSSNNLAPKLNF